MRTLAMLLALSAAACGPDPATIQPWMLGWKSSVNNPGVAVEMPGGIALRVDEDGGGLTYGLYRVSAPTYPITIEPRSADEFWVYGVYDDLDNPLAHDINPDTAWRVRRVRDACGPFERDYVDLETGDIESAFVGELWPGKACVAQYEGPDCDLPGGPYRCYQFVWCPDEPPPPQECQDRWVDEDTLSPDRFGRL